MSEYRTMATKLPIRDFTWIQDYCKRKGIRPSNLIKQLLLEEIGPSASHVAGKNSIAYDKKKGVFNWLVELDDGSKSVVAENVPLEFLEDLNRSINSALISRDEQIGRKKKESIPMPKKLMRGKG